MISWIMWTSGGRTMALKTTHIMTCWKCGHVRAPDAIAPDWQCPACGVAYNKADICTRPDRVVASRRRRGARASPINGRLSQLRAVVVRHRLATAFVAGAVVVLGATAWTYSPWSERSKDLKVADAGMASVRDSLFDVESARWRDVRVVVKNAPNGRLRTLCGEVNAKNRFGGYTGFQRFIATGQIGATFDDGTLMFEGLYHFFCHDERP